MCVVYLLFMCRALFHVDPTTQERQLTEAEEPGVEFSQEQQQDPKQDLSEVADQEQEQDLTNSANPEGKHRFILTQSLISFKSLHIYLCIKLIGIDLIPSCM